MDYDEPGEYEDLTDIADRVYAGAAKQAAKHGFEHLAEAAYECSSPEDVTAAALLDMMALGLTVEQADAAIAAAAITYNLCAIIQAVGEAALAPEIDDEYEN